MDKMPAFCPPNISLSDIWVNHGVSQCFMDTISSSVIGGFILLFGIVQLIIYRKYSTRIETHRIRPSFLYKFQITLMLLLPVLTAVRFDLRWKYYEGAEVYGFMVSSMISNNSRTFHERSELSDSLRIIHNPCVSFRNLFDC